MPQQSQTPRAKELRKLQAGMEDILFIVRETRARVTALEMEGRGVRPARASQDSGSPSFQQQNTAQAQHLQVGVADLHSVLEEAMTLDY